MEERELWNSTLMRICCWRQFQWLWGHTTHTSNTHDNPVMTFGWAEASPLSTHGPKESIQEESISPCVPSWIRIIMLWSHWIHLGTEPKSVALQWINILWPEDVHVFFFLFLFFWRFRGIELHLCVGAVSSSLLGLNNCLNLIFLGQSC